MTRLALAAALLATPLAAQSPADCDAALARIADIGVMLEGRNLGDAQQSDLTTLRALRHSATPDGWCALRPDGPMFDGALFGELHWRAEGLDAFLAGQGMPVALRLRLRDMAAPASGRTYHAEIGIDRVAADGLLLIDASLLAADNRTALQGSLVVQNAFITSPAALSSLTWATARSIAVSGNLTPAIWQDLDVDLDAAALRSIADGLEPGQIDTAGRSALSALADALPRPAGRIEAELRSDRGLGLLQIGVAEDRGGSLGEVAAFALSGATLTVDWRPD